MPVDRGKGGGDTSSRAALTRVALSAFTFADVQGWVSKLVRDGAAPRSVAKVCGVFRQILGWAVQDGRLARNPAEGVPIPRPGLTHHRYLDHTHVATLARECGEYAPLVRLLTYTGLHMPQMCP
jgi:site-specific recombinase XerC